MIFNANFSCCCCCVKRKWNDKCWTLPFSCWQWIVVWLREKMIETRRRCSECLIWKIKKWKQTKLSTILEKSNSITFLSCSFREKEAGLLIWAAANNQVSKMLLPLLIRQVSSDTFFSCMYSIGGVGFYKVNQSKYSLCMF